ncbi:MAG: methyltransferase domain-containing protein [Acidobacteriota bacterium]|jgi:2-polyprenyl-3-methyl-5-hydroxy-6-metoxy-1,4-benzoquinol methylase
MREHVCPPWVGWLLASRVRTLVQDPVEILHPYVKEGMRAGDIGCAMGFFSLPMARLVGPAGRVLCIDLQEKMIASLHRRAQKSGLLDRLDTRVCSRDGLQAAGWKGGLDFALAFAVVHETPDPERFLKDIFGLLRPGGLFLFAEPKGHVTGTAFEKAVSLACAPGMSERARPEITWSHAALFEKV